MTRGGEMSFLEHLDELRKRIVNSVAFHFPDHSLLAIEDGDYGAMVFQSGRVQRSPEKAAVSYVPLVRAIAGFFQTGTIPVSNEETLEMFVFMDAAQQSKARGGAPVRLR